MASFFLRGIDPSLWSRVKARAQEDGIPLREAVLKALKLYADNDDEEATESLRDA